MKVFAIFFCIVIGYVCVDLQRVEIVEDGVKTNKNVRKAASHDASETTNEGQYISSKDVQLPVQSTDANSNEHEASEKPPSVATPMTVTSEEKKSGKKVYLGKRVLDLLLLLKHSHRNISSNWYNSAEDKRSFPRTSAAIRDRNTDEIKTRRLVRKKRAEFSEARKAIRNLHHAKRRESVKRKRSRYDYDIYGVASTKVRRLIEASARVESRLLDSLQKTNSVPTDLLNEYKTAKNLERKAQKESVDFAPNDPDYHKAYPLLIRDDYKNLIDDAVIGYNLDHYDLRTTHQPFFDKPSAARDKYFAMKQAELDSYWPFTDGKITDLYVEPTPNQFEESATEKTDDSPIVCPKYKRESGSQASQKHAEYEVSHIRKRSSMMKLSEHFKGDNLAKSCSVCHALYDIDEANCVAGKRRAKYNCLVKAKDNRDAFMAKFHESESPSAPAAAPAPAAPAAEPAPAAPAAAPAPAAEPAPTAPAAPAAPAAEPAPSSGGGGVGKPSSLDGYFSPEYLEKTCKICNKLAQDDFESCKNDQNGVRAKCKLTIQEMHTKFDEAWSPPPELAPAAPSSGGKESPSYAASKDYVKTKAKEHYFTLYNLHPTCTVCAKFANVNFTKCMEEKDNADKKCCKHVYDIRTTKFQMEFNRTPIGRRDV